MLFSDRLPILLITSWFLYGNQMGFMVKYVPYFALDGVAGDIPQTIFRNAD